MKVTTNRWMAAGLAAIASLVAAGCGHSGANGVAAAKPAPVNPEEIMAPPALMEQVRVGTAHWAEVAGQLRVAGRVEADETRIAQVSAPVSGRIVELDVVEGQLVRKGQVIATIHTTQLTDAQSVFLKAQSQHRLSEQAVKRARNLLQAGVIGEAELQRRDAELTQTAVELAAARDQLDILGMPREALERLEKTRAVNSIAQVISTIDGTVLERRITPGQFVQAADIVCSLADLSQVWLVADIPEQAAGNVQVGKAVEAEIPALPKIPIRGTLSFVSATVNRDTRTVRVRMNLPNSHRRFKPAMLATMAIKEAAQREMVIPSGAVVRESNRDHVFVETSPGRFLLRPVTLGAEFGKDRVVAAGLNPDERIVTDGAFHLNNERKRLAVQGG